MTSRNVYDKRMRVEVFSRNRDSRAWDQQLRIDFDIESTREAGKLGSGKFTLYNLNDDSINLIRSRQAVIRVTGGFEGLTGLLFTGTITRVSVDDTTPDTKVAIEAEDGYARYASVRVNRSWRSTTARTVAVQLADDAGYQIRLPPLAELPDLELPDGYTASGLWRTEFQEIIRSLGGEWSIDLGVVVVVPRGGAVQRRAVLISEDTGMVGIPKETGRNNILVRTLLNPAIRLRQIVRIDSQGVETFARVIKVKHTGSTWDSPFFTDLEVRKLT